MTAARVATHRHGLGWVLTLMVLALTGTACSGTSSTAPPATGPVVVTDAGPIRGTAAGGVDGYLGVPVGAENRDTACDQGVQGQRADRHRPQPAQHDLRLWPSDSRTCCSPAC